MLCSPVIVSLLYQLVHLRWVDHGRQDTQRPWVGHCWCWQLLQAILYVLSIIYYISSPVCVEVLYVDVCVLVHFPVGQLAESKGLVLTWGPFTVNLTPLRGQDRAAFCFFWFNLLVWHKAQCSSHCTKSKNGCKFIRKETIYKNAEWSVAKPPSGLSADPSAAEFSLIRIQQSEESVGSKECSPACLLLQTVV